ncbi:MAG: RAMP superfamily protein [Virgibacillus proomii]
MPKYKLTITLQSDLSPGSGDSIAGVVDHDITHEHGIPTIPAKRIKGALRGVAKEFVDWGFASQCEVDQLFGKPGAQYSSRFKIYDAKLASIPAGYFDNKDVVKVDDYDTFIAQIKKHDTAKVLSLFTMLYTKTATEHGQAETGSLRTIRVINRDLVFKSIIELETNAQAALLNDCVKGLRHLGYGRTRGLGEVECKLEEDRSSVETGIKLNVAIKNSDQEDQFVKQVLRITLQQPTLLAGSKGLYYSCTDFVPGSALLGVFASLYIKKHNLEDDAHKNSDFARLFLRGDVSFGYAYPEVVGKVFMPCPAHIQRIKNENRAMLEEKKTDPTIVLRKINSLAYMEESTNELLLHVPAKEFRMHHSRPEDRRIGRAVNDTKGAEIVEGEKGQFYYYIALCKGQSFISELKGKQKDIQMLVSLLKEVDHTIHLGRSRTAEYGAAKVEMVDKTPNVGVIKAQKGDQKVAIYLVTPLTLQNEVGRYVVDAELLIAQLERELGAPLKVEKMYLKETVLTGYNAKWRLPKQEKLALDAGTVLIVSTQAKDVDWSLVEEQQWGTETGQGCGEISVLRYTQINKQFTCKSMNKLKKDDIHVTQLQSVNQYIIDQLQANETAKKTQAKAIQAAQKFIKKHPAIKSIGQTKLFQLKKYFLDKDPELDKEKLFSKLPNQLGEILEKHLRDKGNIYQQYFFHTIKLELRKDAR